MPDRKTAFVTGASRGIGKYIALSLAEAGFDVAITARTVEPGEQREHSSSIVRSDTSPLPGSLRETADLIGKTGVEVLLLPADIIDRASLGAAVTTFLDRWGAPDVIVNNARFIGPGHMDTLLGAPISAIENHMQGNFFAPLVIDKMFLPAMIERGRGTIIHLTSSSGFSTPHAAAGKGGWGISYGSTKAAIHRVAGILSKELDGTGISVINVDPGYIATERIAQDMAGFGFAADGEPPEVVGAVIAWLATNPEAAEFNGETVFAQDFCNERNLYPAWPGPKLRPQSSQPDTAAQQVARLNEKYSPKN
jgi:NAD(P)-dependent dehydrogenase (short-subunit alcohol dehydrogenase family)